MKFQLIVTVFSNGKYFYSVGLFDWFLQLHVYTTKFMKKLLNIACRHHPSRRWARSFWKEGIASFFDWNKERRRKIEFGSSNFLKKEKNEEDNGGEKKIKLIANFGYKKRGSPPHLYNSLFSSTVREKN